MEGEIKAHSFGNILTALSDLVLPRVCAVCGRQLLPVERGICVECLADLPETCFAGLLRNPMADKYNARVEELREPEDGFEPYSPAAALFFYQAGSGYSHITQDIKYNRHFALGREFSGMLGRRLAAKPVWRDVDAVVPVPLHWLRRFGRGYNQAEIIARELASSLPCARVFPSVLRRTRRTSTQTALGYEEKRVNVSGAFEVNAAALKKMLRTLDPQHVLLVDDVFTTGATLSECHRVLRRALGPGIRISAATLACWKE